MGKLSKACLHVAEIYGATEISKLFEVINQLGESFAKSVTSCQNLRELVRHKFNWITKDYTNELEELKNLVNRYDDSKMNYIEASKALNENKEKLFALRKIDGWELKEDCKYSVEQLLSDKEIGFSVMLPQETERVRKLKDYFGFFCNEVPKEYKRVCERKTEELKEMFMEIARVCCSEFIKVMY